MMCLLLGGATRAETPFFAEQSEPEDWLVAKGCDWMARVSDEHRVSHLSLPGTHDSCAVGGRVGLAGGLARTQRWPLAMQLEAGIRFLDIRCRQVEDRFAIHHGMVDLGMDFAEVRDVCEAFLAKHPSECLVMNIQREHTVIGKHDFGETLQAYLTGHEAAWEWRLKQPKLGQVRGKVVLLSRNASVDRVLETEFRWKDLIVSNEWNAPKRTAKWSSIERNLRQVPQKPGQWFLTFSSATSLPWATPHDYALDMNKRLYDWLGANPNNCVGIVAMDFPGNELVDRIIRTNQLAETNLKPESAGSSRP